MTNFQRLATVRTRFLRWLQEADQHSEDQPAKELGPDGSLICRESMLIRDEFFCGRKFHARHYTAVWFIEEDVLKIYRADNSLELVLRGDEIDVCEIAESAVGAGELADAAEWQLDDELTAEVAIGEPAPADAAEALEAEPRILKLTTAHEDGSDLNDSSAHVSGKMQPNVQQTGEMDSGEQEIRKAA